MVHDKNLIFIEVMEQVYGYIIGTTNLGIGGFNFGGGGLTSVPAGSVIEGTNILDEKNLTIIKSSGTNVKLIS